VRCFKATIEYDGTDFAGFQWQTGQRTVQETFEDALKVRTGQTVRISGAGRTDAGVHALGQVVSFGVETSIPTERLALALNGALPLDLSVRDVVEVSPEFDARFSASSRVYAYLIQNRRTPSALFRRFTAFCPQMLDVAAMNSAAQSLLGERDFAAFANELHDDRVTMREMMRFTVGRFQGLVVVRVEANAFLRGMVRNLVGTLMEVGQGKRSPDSLEALLASRDRRQAGATAPPQGLCLLKARYGVRKVYARPREESS
jgi:tRNA pseudouridine38-40 synthase